MFDYNYVNNKNIHIVEMSIFGKMSNAASSYITANYPCQVCKSNLLTFVVHISKRICTQNDFQHEVNICNNDKNLYKELLETM